MTRWRMAMALQALCAVALAVTLWWTFELRRENDELHADLVRAHERHDDMCRTLRNQLELARNLLAKGYKDQAAGIFGASPPMLDRCAGRTAMNAAVQASVFSDDAALGPAIEAAIKSIAE